VVLFKAFCDTIHSDVPFLDMYESRSTAHCYYTPELLLALQLLRFVFLWLVAAK
jgi:hypothetical protein